jgi:8-hydroxy-5-deazaflavin:NADPH oxidoreductase
LASNVRIAQGFDVPLPAERREHLMPKLDDIDHDRRKVIAAGALLFGAALWPANLRAEKNSGSKMPVGTIGAGHIGGTIGGLWVKNGQKVLFSSRHPEELKDLVENLGPLAQAGTVNQAIAFGDAVLISVPYRALPQIGRDYAAALRGKIVLDTCNAVAARDGKIADEVQSNGVGVTSQKYLPGTRLVRAFNTMSYRIFASEANRPDPKLAVPIAGDDPEAVQVAAGLVRDAGFDPVIVGKLVDAKLFQRGGPAYGQPVSAAELKQKLSLQ